MANKKLYGMQSFKLLRRLQFVFILLLVQMNKVRNTPTIRKRYNQVRHLTQDITWEINKKQ